MSLDLLITIKEIAIFIFGLAALIFIHELGHFLAARALKVEVEEFGIGFPPRAIKLFEQKGTEFTLNWIPLGGFVRPKGENDPTVPGGLAAASPWVRLGVLFAGPMMNIAAGLIIGMALAFSRGDPIPTQVIIQKIAPASPAEMAGLLPGDRFVQVAGREIDSIATVTEAISQNLGKEITVVVLRDGQEITLALTPRVNPPKGEGSMGVLLGNARQPIPPAAAIERGAVSTYQIISNIFTLPVKMIQGEIEPEQGRVLGYYGMFRAYRFIQDPWWFFMFLSISLGVMNLLPIPALDGGRILLTMPEILIRKRIPAQYENMIHLVGFIALILLLIYVNIQDVINPPPFP
jgi:regulator of sigma E protease